MRLPQLVLQLLRHLFLLLLCLWRTQADLLSSTVLIGTYFYFYLLLLWILLKLKELLSLSSDHGVRFGNVPM